MKPRPTSTGLAALLPAPMSPEQVADLVARVRYADYGAPMRRAVERVLHGEKATSAAAAEGCSSGGYFYRLIRRAKRKRGRK